jgi:hypothetical protein
VQALPGQVNVVRAYEGTTPQAWPAGTRMSKLSPKSGFSSNVEWRAVLSNITVTGDASLKVGGGAARIEESDARCRYSIPARASCCGNICTSNVGFTVFRLRMSPRTRSPRPGSL